MRGTRRFAGTIVCTMAMLGCAGDTLVEPVAVSPVVPAPSTPAVSAESTVPSRNAPSDTADSKPVTPADVGSGNETARTAAPVADTARTGSVGVERYGREQSLGFQREQADDNCLAEGQSTGVWTLRYSGYGCVALTNGAMGTALSMAPATANEGAETHAPLLLGPVFGERMTMTARVETVQQLRRNGEPNAWEVAWIVWHYQDDDHFYYFIPKPNGWELGKRDPSYPGGQRFLASSTEQKFPVGRAYNVQVIQRGNLFAVSVDGVALVNFTDSERPYTSGRIALYSEDAEIRVHQVSVRSGAF